MPCQVHFPFSLFIFSKVLPLPKPPILPTIPKLPARIGLFRPLHYLHVLDGAVQPAVSGVVALEVLALAQKLVDDDYVVAEGGHVEHDLVLGVG